MKHLKTVIALTMALVSLYIPAHAATTPPECIGLSANDWTDIQQNYFSFSGSGTLVSVVYDTAASDRLAAKMPANHSQWAVQYHIPSNLVGLWHCYARIKCDATSNTGQAFIAGLWDFNADAPAVKQTIMLQNGAGDGQYHTYDLGIQQLTTNMGIWVQPPGSTSVTPAVYVDRFFFVRMTNVDRLSELAGIADNYDISLDSQKVVTTYPGTFTDGSVYVEEPDRSSGIKCVFNSGVQQPNLASKVKLAGKMATDAAGQRYINVSSVTQEFGDPIDALGAGVKSISYGRPDMSGLLVRVWGKVSYVDPNSNYFYVDDGSGLVDASGVAYGLRVKLDGLASSIITIPAVGDFVTFTGIASRDLVPDSTIIPVLQPTGDQDIWDLKDQTNVTPNVPDVQQDGFNLPGLGTYVTLVNDPLASDGVAAKMPANIVDWRVQYPIPASLASASPIHCYARIRCDATNQTGPAFTVGIWNLDTRKAVIEKTIMLEDGAGDGQYHIYDLGVHDLTTNMLIWVAPTGRSQETPAVYVDCFHFECAPMLADKGKTGYTIVVGNNATIQDYTAATELQQHLKAVTGVVFPVKSEKLVSSASPQILVGQSDRVNSLLPGFNWGSLGTEGIVMKTVGNSLILAGGRPRGTIYAVDTFLEDFVGCRWWTSTESYTPNKPKLWISQIDKTYVPQLIYRDPFYLDTNSNGVFAARLKDNGYAPVPDAYGGHNPILGFCHTFRNILPADTYFASHPEWYSLIDGERTGDNTQLCLTNTEMQQQAISNVLAWIAANPDTAIVSVSQNDNQKYCQCAECQAVADAEESQAGPIIRFVNIVANAVKAVYPNIKVETLAYQYSANPPKITRPADNVYIRLCDIESDFIQPLNSSANASFQSNLEGWSAITQNLLMWDYVADFVKYIAPQPTMNHFGANINFFVANNIKGVFEEGDYGCAVGDFCRLKCWVLAHLLWDPSLDQTALVNEFLNGYYGAAAPYISQYLTLTYNAALAAGYPITCFNTDYSFLTLSVMNQAAQLSNNAASAVANDPVLSARVKRDMLPLQHIWIMNHPAYKQQQVIYNLPFYGPTDQLASCNDFISTAESYNTREVAEGYQFEIYKQVLLPQCRPAATVPTECQGLTNWIDVPNNMFKLYKPGTESMVIADSAASTGYTVKMMGNYYDWVVQYPVSSFVANAGRWHCYARVKCDVNGTTGNAFDVGLYDSSIRQNVFTMTPTLQDGAKDGLYHTYDLGVHTLTANQVFWFSTTNNPSLVPAVYVDRMFMIKAD